MKYGPLIAMIGMLLAGAWLVWGPLTRVKDRRWPESQIREVLISGSRGNLEVHFDAEQDRWLFCTHMRDGYVSPTLTAEQVLPLLGPRALRQATEESRSPILRFFNINSWTNLVWISVGLFGQLVFSGRIILQWVVSEKQGVSTVPVAFWWLSLGGGVCLFSYFIWRQDFVGILGQAPGVVIYARNLHLIYRPRTGPVTSPEAPDPVA